MFTCICVADSQLGVDLCSDEFFMRAMEASPSVFGSWTGGLSGFTNSAVVSAVCWPNTTRSSRDSAPGRFAPWTEAQPDSPDNDHGGRGWLGAIRGEPGFAKPPQFLIHTGFLPGSSGLKTQARFPRGVVLEPKWQQYIRARISRVHVCFKLC